jgi:hypothetical protein
VSKLTKDKPRTGETPRDSLMAQMISWFSAPKVETPVLGLAVLGLPVLRRPVRGREIVVA